MTLAEFTEDALKRITPVCADSREAQNILTLLLEELINLNKTQQKMLAEKELSGEELDKLSRAVQRLQSGEPIQYVSGMADFFGMKFKVNPNVLIPRPETEELVGLVLKTLQPVSKQRHLRIVDIGTGSGCIAITLKKKLPDAEILAIDKSEEALEIATANDARLHAGADFLHCDFLDEHSWQSLGVFDAVVSNPPYVTRLEFPLLMQRVRDFEPRQALIADSEDDFIFYRKIADFGIKHLKSDGFIFTELNSAHAGEIASIFKRNGYRNTLLIKDLQGNERILEARK